MAITKRQRLLNWSKERGWFYLSNVPYDTIGMSRQTCSSALIDFCEQGKMDFRIQGLKQYKLRETK